MGAPAVGIDIGGSKILGLCRDGSAALQVPSPSSGEAVLEAVAGLARSLGACEGSAVGVGVPGLVDSAGVLRFSPHLPGLVGLPIAEALRGALGASAVWVGNDATAACWGEHLMGAAQGARDALMVTLGTGIGGGILAGGKLQEGSTRFAGEFGHMVVDPHGPPCPCGKRGCWERWASGSGLGRLGREVATAGRAARLVELAGGDPEAIRGEHVVAAAKEGDETAARLLESFGWWLALGLANLVNAFDPAVVVLGGGLAAAAELVLPATRRAFAELVEAPELRKVQIVAAALGPGAGALGAALLAEALGSGPGEG